MRQGVPDGQYKIHGQSRRIRRQVHLVLRLRAVLPGGGYQLRKHHSEQRALSQRQHHRGRPEPGDHKLLT